MSKKWHKGLCVLASGRAGSDGYGKKKIGGRTYRAHRVAYCAANSVSLESIVGLIVLHKCDNRMCVNPDHLALGSHEENMKDMVAKDRQARGERAGRAKLTEAQVAEIKSSYIKSSRTNCARALAEKYGVCRRAVAQIVQGRNWSWL